jgi:DNA helicase II / ATP-dependent DNA helicase PcrA
MDRARLLDGLDDAQREAVTTARAPLAILAGPGSGKTRVLTHRIAWQLAEGRAEPGHVLAVTFTRKAAGELGRRLRALGAVPAEPAGGVPAVTAGTLHSVALVQLRRRAARRDRPMPEVLERKARLLVRIVGGRGAEAATAAADAAGEIEWAKARLLSPDEYAEAAAPAGRAPARGIDASAEAYRRYEQAKRRARLVDFDDLLWWCGDALADDEEFAHEQRFRFRSIFVDEFQDVSPAQLRLVRGWLGDRADLTVVGDPDQAIFSFTGADPGALTRFVRHFPGAHLVRLRTNYRSTPEIVETAEAVLADGGARRGGHRAVRGSGPRAVVTAYGSESEEAAGVAERLRTLRRPGAPWSDFAVLYRTNAQSAGFEAALGAAGIPARVRGDQRFLDRPEVALVLDQLRASAAHAPGASLAHHLTDLEVDHGDDDGEARREHAVAVAALGREYLEAEPAGTLVGFIAWMRATLHHDAPLAGGDAVELLTFHRAKGLEFDVVFVTGLERGLVPIARAETPAERAEERRLLYVALTRAAHRLELSWARRRSLGTRIVGRAPSPWLAPIEALDTPAAGPAATPVPRGLGAARDQLARGRDRGTVDGEEPDAALLAALVEWRRQLARAAGIPAYVIFHDATLRTIATARPGSRDALFALPGIGPVKLERYADAVLGLVREHGSVPAVASV